MTCCFCGLGTLAARVLTSLGAVTVFLVGMPSDGLAWGQTGHRVAAAIAERYLSLEARAAIADILEPAETLAEASTWPDFMRSSPQPFWQNTAPPFHYVTVPPGKTYAEVGAPAQGDAVTALATFKATLTNPVATRLERQLALRFTIHIIADLHQPLHAGNGSDNGGNLVRLKFFGQDTNLHAVWDEGLIEREGLSHTEWVAWLLPKITDAFAREWWSNDPLVWIGESVVLRDTIYPNIDSISWTYGFDHIASVRRRLQMAGVRTAAYLNGVFVK
jgi:S1/P1 Nuclease